MDFSNIERTVRMSCATREGKEDIDKNIDEILTRDSFNRRHLKSFY